MKSALLLTAILSGLCAEVMASPIGDMNYQTRTAPVIEGDLDFNAGSIDDPFPDQDAEASITTSFDDRAVDEGEFAIDGNEISGSPGVPEPPPVTLLLIGLSSLGVFALWRRTRWERRRSRRRTVVRMRALTAKR